MQNILTSIRAKSPLIHNITNYVVMNNTANALLALGASPVMAHAVEEVEDICAISSALVINIGTLSPRWTEAMVLAGKKANQLGIPVVIDPVGMGASTYRNDTLQRLLQEIQPAIIRGNASEIMALHHAGGKTKGVDSTAAADEAREAGAALSRHHACTVVVSGKTDYVFTADRTSSIHGGSAMMSRVTGMGCTATAILAACAAVESDVHAAAVAGMDIMAEAGEEAEKRCDGPGSFQMHFLDRLYHLGSI